MKSFCVYLKILAVLSLGIFANLASAQRSLDVGTISRLNEAKTVPICWVIKSREHADLIDRALSLNGGFVKVSESAASVIAEFTETGAGDIQLSLQGNKPRRILYTETFHGGRSAALKAANKTVEKVLGIPGFYLGKLAFVSSRTHDSELYISDLFFQNIRQITSDRSLCTSPHLSPTGRALTYTAYYKSGQPDLFRIDLASGRRRALASFEGLNMGGDFSPNGRYLSMILSSAGNPELYLADPNGKIISRLTKTPGIESGGSFSPDSKRLVFTSDMAGKPQLYVMDIKGGSMMRIPTNISSYCAEPDWNPVNPDQIAFTVAAGGEFEVAIYDFAEKKSRIMTRGAGDALEPCWLNDGRHLIYTARTSNFRQLYILDTETGRAMPLTSKEFGKVWQASFSN